MKTNRIATTCAVLASALYAVSIPLSKLLLWTASPTMMAAFLYLGAGIGMFILGAAKRFCGKGDTAEPLTKKELPYTAAMVVLDTAAPILLMFGIKESFAANVSLINNFEIVATSLIALLIFKEIVSQRLWIAISLVSVASVILSFEGKDAFSFNLGSLYVFGACLCWGLENNCTRALSQKSSYQIVTVKGLFSGLGSLIVAFLLCENLPGPNTIIFTLLLGFASYGLSIHFYILAQKELGAAKTSAYFSIAPFLGVSFGMLILGERPNFQFYIALGIMLVATLLMAKDTISLQHVHEHAHTHTHEHIHNGVPHIHEHTHIHEHSHIHGREVEAHEHNHSDMEEHNHTH